MSDFLEVFIAQVIRANPMQARALQDAHNGLRPKERDELRDYLAFCVAQGVDINRLVASYQTITQDTLREQVYFQRNGTYRYRSFAEVADKVYFDAEYMSSYMYGLALTLYLWPNHRDMVRFFQKEMSGRKGLRYLEVGPGHGVFFRNAIREGGYAHYLGIDISPTSLDLTRRLVSSDNGLQENWELRESDFLQVDELDPGFDAIVMGEVLEHVEDPSEFLRRVRDLARPGAFIYVTTAVNAPAIDHIFLFSSVDEVVQMCEVAGLRVVEILAPPYLGCTMEETVLKKLPINVALTLTL